MIPKKIHYCWFGRGEKPRLSKRCIASWHRFCPDYEIIEWNEENFQLDSLAYTRYCYDRKQYAFLSDFVRLIVVSEQGGIYFDTDVELIRKPDELLAHKAFYGFENDQYVATGLGFGAVAHHVTVEAMKQQYMQIFQDSAGQFPLLPCPSLNTQALLPFGLKRNGLRQNVAEAEILPTEYMNPYDDPTGRMRKTENTVSIHWYSKSWMNKSTIVRSRITRPFHRLFGTECFRWLK